MRLFEPYSHGSRARYAGSERRSGNPDATRTIKQVDTKPLQRVRRIPSSDLRSAFRTLQPRQGARLVEQSALADDLSSEVSLK